MSLPQRELLEAMMRGAGPPGIGHWWEGAAAVRAKVGRFIGCDPEDVAMLRSTGEGIALVSLGLDWEPGDEVVLYEQESPAVFTPSWRSKKGVKIKFVKDHGRHRFEAGDVAAVMSSSTREQGRGLGPRGTARQLAGLKGLRHQPARRRDGRRRCHRGLPRPVAG
jgi:hypothetical protein